MKVVAISAAVIFAVWGGDEVVEPRNPRRDPRLSPHARGLGEKAALIRILNSWFTWGCCCGLYMIATILLLLRGR